MEAGDEELAGSGLDALPEELTPAAWVTDGCLAFLKDRDARRRGRPFFLHASYVAPHPPYRPLARYANLYPAAEVALPRSFDLAKANAWWTSHPGREPLDLLGFRRMRALYLAFVTQLDVIEKRRPGEERHAETVVHVVVEVRTGRDDPVHEARLH